MIFNTKIYFLVILYTSLSFDFCHAGEIMEIPFKCSIKDEKCKIKMYETLVTKYAKSGIPAIGIPAYDPYIVKDMTVPVLGIVNLTIAEGKVEGVASCQLKKYKWDFESKITTSEALCDSIRMAGHYKIAPGPLADTISAKGVSGEGNGAVQIDKMVLKIKFPFHLKKHDDGEIYAVINTSEATFSTKVKSKISFEADNIMMGGEEVSKTMTTFMNNNWKSIYTSFGNMISDKVMMIYFEYLNKLFDKVPATNFFTEDLTPYLE